MHIHIMELNIYLARYIFAVDEITPQLFPIYVQLFSDNHLSDF